MTTGRCTSPSCPGPWTRTATSLAAPWLDRPLARRARFQQTTTFERYHITDTAVLGRRRPLHVGARYSSGSARYRGPRSGRGRRVGTGCVGEFPGVGKPRLVLPGARLARDEATT